MRTIVPLQLAVMVLFAGCAFGGNPEAESLAIQSAADWLKLVDSEQYAASWKEAAVSFKSAVTVEAWEQAIKAARGPLGKVVSRELKSKTYTTTLPGAPDGEYVVIQYDTVFEKEKATVETVTPILDRDGKWRVSGYHIK